MNFGEKVRTLRKEKGMSQGALAKAIGVSLRTVQSYETGKSYPRRREIYGTLARILGCERDYLMTESDAFITSSQELFGYRGAKGAEQLVRELTGLFAGGEMAEEDMDALMLAVQQAYVDAKRKNRKYTPKKYLSEEPE